MIGELITELQSLGLRFEGQLSKRRGGAGPAEGGTFLIEEIPVSLPIASDYVSKSPYSLYEIKRPEEAGELLMGISIVHPGKVGREFFMTKGHYHTVLDTAEIYYVLKGEGFMVMETPEGLCAVEPLSPGQVLYVPPRWAHRSVCTSRQEDLVTFFVYPGKAGHDYGTIEQKGFHKLVLEWSDGIEITDNPRWKA